MCSSDLPLKDYRDFKDSDCLAPLLSHLSQASQGEKVIVQYLLTPATDSWKTPGIKILTPDSEGKLSIDANAKALIEKKLQEKGFFINPKGSHGHCE